MNVGRGASQPWEIRLGAVQVMLLSGVSAGALIGSYFMGFFAGQNFGFETSRVASSVEVAKLPIGDIGGEDSTAVSEIYAHLQDAALPEVSEPVVKVGGSRKEKAGEVTLPAVKMAQEIESGVPAESPDITKGSLHDSRMAAADPAETRMLKEAGQRAHARMLDTEKAPAAAGADPMGNGLHGEDRAFEDLPSEATLPKQNVRILGGGREVTDDAKGGGNSLGAALEESLTGKDVGAPGKKDAVAKVHGEIFDAPSSFKNGKGIEPAHVGAEPAKKAGEGLVKEEKAGKPLPVAEVPTKVPTPKVSGGLVKRTLPPGHFAQVAAPKKLSDAEDIARKLKKSGFPVVVEVASIQGVEYFRVLVGPEENKVQAERLVDQLGSERYIPGKPFIRVVK